MTPVPKKIEPFKKIKWCGSKEGAKAFDELCQLWFDQCREAERFPYLFSRDLV